MSIASSVVIGLATVFFGLLFISFKLNDSEQPLFNYLGVLFMALAVATLQVVGWSALQIAENNGMTYISTGASMPVLWIVNIAMFSFWITLAAKSLWMLTVFLFTWANNKFGGSSDSSDGGVGL